MAFGDFLEEQNDGDLGEGLGAFVANGEGEGEGMGEDPKLLKKFCNNYLGDLQSTLVPWVAEIVLMVRIGGTRRTAKFLGEELGRKMSRQPIETLMTRVKKGELVVTQEDLERVATSHPIARRFVQKAPWLVDPKSKELIVPEPPKPKGRRGRPKKEAPEGKESLGASSGSPEPSQGSKASQKPTEAPQRGSGEGHTSSNASKGNPADTYVPLHQLTPEHFADYPEKTKAPMLKLLEMRRKRKAGIPIHSSDEDEDEKE